MKINNVDTTKTITHLGLCAGYGGIELGLKRVLPTMRTVALCEIEAFAIANLVAKMEAGLMDPAPIWTNLKTFPWAEFRDRVDVLTGGYPCQPFSSAGKRAGADDPRHLWPYIASGIRLLKPRVCFFENVEGHITLGLSTVISDLEEMGYNVSFGIFSASECGAPHQRKRVFILAYRNSERGQLSNWWKQSTEQMSIGNGKAWRDVWPSRPGEPQHDWEPPRVVAHSQRGGSKEPEHKHADLPTESSGSNAESVANSESKRASRGQQLCGKECGQGRALSSESDESGESVGNAPVLDGSGQTGGQWQAQVGRAGPEWHNGQTEPTLGRSIDGASDRVDYAELCVSCDNRTDELRLLGNGVVPATAELAFRTLLKQL